MMMLVIMIVAILYCTYFRGKHYCYTVAHKTLYVYRFRVCHLIAVFAINFTHGNTQKLKFATRFMKDKICTFTVTLYA